MKSRHVAGTSAFNSQSNGLGCSTLLVAAFVFFLLSALLLLTSLAALLSRLAGLRAMLTGLSLSTLLTLILLTVFLHIVCHEVFLPKVRVTAHPTI